MRHPIKTIQRGRKPADLVRIPAFFAFACLLLGYGGATPLLGQVYSFRDYTVRDGLISNSIRCLYQDTTGFLWIGTSEGISRFDGTRFMNYTVRDGLPKSHINWICGGRSEARGLWVATNGGGVCFLRDDSVRVIRMPGDEKANRVNMVVEDAVGRLWCATDDGLFLVNRGVVQRVSPDSSWKEVVAVQSDGDGVMFSTRTAIYHMSGPSDRPRMIAPGFGEGVFVVTATVTGPGEYWVAGSSGELAHLRDGEPVVKIRGADLSHPISMRSDPKGVVWLSSYEGVFSFPNSATTTDDLVRTTIDNGLPENGIFTTWVDREDNVWFGTLSKGMSILESRDHISFKTGVPIPVANDAAITLDGRQRAWVLCPGGVMEIWRGPHRRWKSMIHRLSSEAGEKETPTGIVFDIARGGFWMSSTAGTLVFHDVSGGSVTASRMTAGRTLRSGRDFPAGLLYRFLVTPDSKLLCSIGNVGIVMIDPWDPAGARSRVIYHDPEIQHSDIRALCLARDGTLWVGDYIAGLTQLRPVGDTVSLVRKYTAPGDISDNSIRAIHEDPFGRIWVGTRYGGITVIGDSIRRITVTEGLLSNAVWSIREDRSGTIWLGTQSGLQSLKPGDPDRFEVDDMLFGSVIVSCEVGADGVLWMYSTDVVTLIDPEIVPSPAPAPPVVITALRVAGSDFPITGRVELSYWQSSVAVDYTGLSYTLPGKMRYVYKLEGADREWQPATTQRSLTYAALKPGEYRFEVKAISGRGVVSTVPAFAEFSVSAPFWDRWWFIAGTILLVFIAGYGLYRYRLSGFRAIEEVRSRIANDLHDDIGSDLTQIAILSEVLKADSGSPESLSRLEKIGSMSRRILDGMSDLVWYIDPAHDSVADLANRIRDTAAGLLAGGDVSFALSLGKSAESLKLTPEIKKEVQLAVKEAMTNAVRHSGCSSIMVTIALKGQRFHVEVSDDGTGVNSGVAGGGHGLANMKTRAEHLGGSMRVSTPVDGGTLVSFDIPMRGSSRKTTETRG